MKRIHQINLQTRFPQHRATARVSTLSTSCTLSTLYPPPQIPLTLRFYGSADWAPKLPDPIWLTEFRNIHGSVTAGNYIVMATRSSSPTVVFIFNILNPNYFHVIPLPSPSSWDESYDWTADYGYRYVPSLISLEQLHSRYSACDAACYSPVTKKAYLELYGGSGKYISVIEIDPKTALWQGVIMDPIHVDPDAYSNGGVICCDDEHLYVTTYGVEFQAIEAMIYKYSLLDRDEDGQLRFIASAKLESFYSPHSMGIADGSIYLVSGLSTTQSIIRISAATLEVLAAGVLPSYAAITDDLTITPTDVWIGIEMGTSGTVRIDRATLQVVQEYLLPNTNIFGTNCFGAWYHDALIYLAFGSVPTPVIARLDPATDAIQYALFDWDGYMKNPENDQWGFNEICHHPATGLFFASLWDEAPPVIARFHPSQITWIDLDISQTQLPAPLFTLPPSPFTSHSLFTLSCENAAAAIYYTLDGSVPTAESTLYTGPFSVDSPVPFSIRAIAILSGFLDSEVTSSDPLTILYPPAAPISAQASEVYDFTFKANWAESDNAISYELDVSKSIDFGTFVLGYNSKPVSGTSHDITVPNEGERYYYRLRAVNAAGKSANSAVITVETYYEPITLTGSVSTASIRLMWNGAPTSGNINTLINAGLVKIVGTPAATYVSGGWNFTGTTGDKIYFKPYGLTILSMDSNAYTWRRVGALPDTLSTLWLRTAPTWTYTGALPASLSGYVLLVGAGITWTYNNLVHGPLPTAPYAYQIELLNAASSVSITGAFPAAVHTIVLRGNSISWIHSGNLPAALVYVYLYSTWHNFTGVFSAGSTNISSITLINWRTTAMTGAELIALLASIAARTGKLPATITIKEYGNNPTVNDITAASPNASGTDAEQIKYWINTVLAKNNVSRIILNATNYDG